MANPFFPTEPEVLTEEQKQAQRLTRVITQLGEDGKRLLEQAIRTIQNNWQRVWENQTFTPAEIVAQMGTDAVEIFRTSAIFTAAVYQIGAEATPAKDLLDVKYLSAKFPYTPNPDGSITPNDNAGWTTLFQRS